MSEKLPEAVDFGSTPSLHFVHMRGLPFQANAQDIINVCGSKLRRLEQSTVRLVLI